MEERIRSREVRGLGKLRQIEAGMNVFGKFEGSKVFVALFCFSGMPFTVVFSNVFVWSRGRVSEHVW